MATVKNKVLIGTDDFETLSAYVRGLNSVKAFDSSNAAVLKDELKKATVVKTADMPADVVRLNSTIVVKDALKNKQFEVVLVIPEKADIKQHRISVFAPLGTALIGFKQGDNVKWKVPEGVKTFTIVKVTN